MISVRKKAFIISIFSIAACFNLWAMKLGVNEIAYNFEFNLNSNLNEDLANYEVFNAPASLSLSEESFLLCSEQHSSNPKSSDTSKDFALDGHMQEMQENVHTLSRDSSVASVVNRENSARYKTRADEFDLVKVIQEKITANEVVMKQLADEKIILEKELSKCFQRSSTKQIIRQKIAFINALQNGSLVKIVSTIQKSDIRTAIRVFRTELKPLWAWPHKLTYLVEQDNKPAENAFIKVLGVNVMKEVESYLVSRLDFQTRYSIAPQVKEFERQCYKNLTVGNRNNVMLQKTTLQRELLKFGRDVNQQALALCRAKLAITESLLNDARFQICFTITHATLPIAQCEYAHLEAQLKGYFESQNIKSTAAQRAEMVRREGFDILTVAKTLLATRLENISKQLEPMHRMLSTIRNKDLQTAQEELCCLKQQFEEHCTAQNITTPEAMHAYITQCEGFNVPEFADALFESRPGQPNYVSKQDIVHHENLLTREIEQKKYEEIFIAQPQIVEALNASTNHQMVADRLTATRDMIFYNAAQYDLVVSPGVNLNIQSSINALSRESNLIDFSLHVRTLEHVFDDVQKQTALKANLQPSLFSQRQEYSTHNDLARYIKAREHTIQSLPDLSTNNNAINTTPNSGGRDFINDINKMHSHPDSKPADLTENPDLCKNWSSTTFLHAMAVHFGRCIESQGSIQNISGYWYAFTLDGRDYYIPYNQLDSIMQTWKLYEYDNFWTCIKKFPNYLERIDNVHNQMHEDKAIENLLSEKGHGKLCKEGRRASAELRRQEQERIDARARQGKIAHENFCYQTRRTFAENQEALLQQTPEYEELLECKIGDSGRIQERVAAINDIKNTKACYENKRYLLPAGVATDLSNAGYDGRAYRSCYGNQLQQVIHADCITLLKEIAVLPATSVIYDYKSTLIDSIDAAREYNQAGFCNKAINVTDFCWSMLDYGKAIMRAVADGALDVAERPGEYAQAMVEGVTHGVAGAAQDLIKHPLHTAACVIAPEGAFVYQLSKVLINVLDISIVRLFDKEEGNRRWDEYVAPLKTLIDDLSKKQVSGPEAVRDVTRFACHWKAQNKLLSGLNKFYATTKDKLEKFVKENPLASPEQYMTTPEGMMFKASSETIQAQPIRQSNHPASCHCYDAPIRPAPIREIVLPRVNTYGEAHKKAWEIIKKVDHETAVPYVGKKGVGKDKLVGMRWHNNKVVMRLDWDGVKGPHINVIDYRLNKGADGISFAIPFKGSEKNLKKLLNYLNTEANLENARQFFKKMNDEISLGKIEATISELAKPRSQRKAIKVCNREY